MQANHNRELLNESEYKAAGQLRVGTGRLRRWRLDKGERPYVEGLLSAGLLSSDGPCGLSGRVPNVCPADTAIGVPAAKHIESRQPAQIAGNVVTFRFINPILVATNAGIIAGEKRGHRAN